MKLPRSWVQLRRNCFWQSATDTEIVRYMRNEIETGKNWYINSASQVRKLGPFRTAALAFAELGYEVKR